MRVIGLTSLALITLFARGVWAQEAERPLGAVAVVAGEFLPEDATRFDAGASVIGVRLARPLSRLFVAEAALSYTPNERRRGIATDIGLQAQLPHWRYRPYIGAAFGALRAADTESARLVPAVSAAIGAWIGATPNVTLMGEIRMRNPLDGRAIGGSEQTIGVAWRI